MRTHVYDAANRELTDLALEAGALWEGVEVRPDGANHPALAECEADSFWFDRPVVLKVGKCESGKVTVWFRPMTDHELRRWLDGALA